MGVGAPGTFASPGVAEEQTLSGKSSAQHGTDTWPGLPDWHLWEPLRQGQLAPFVDSAEWDLAGGAAVQKAKGWEGERGRRGEGGREGARWEGREKEGGRENMNDSVLTSLGSTDREFCI